MTEDSARLAEVVRSHLRDVADFPEPGVLFKDISPLLADATAFAAVIRGLADVVSATGDTVDTVDTVDIVAGVEARGFLLAGALARELDCGVVMVRKAGKLPPPTIKRAYELEYGTAEIEVPVNLLAAQRVLLVDDVLATGGTLRAAAELVNEAGGTVSALVVLLELGFLGGRDVLQGLAPIRSLLTL